MFRCWVQNLYFSYISFYLYIHIYIYICRIALWSVFACLIYLQEIFVRIWSFTFSLCIQMGSSTPLSKHSTRIKELSPFSWVSNKWIFVYNSACDSLFVDSSIFSVSFSHSVCLVFVSFLFSLKFNLFCNYSSNTGWLMPLLFIYDVVHLNGTISICDTHKNSFSGIIYPLLRMNPISAIRMNIFFSFSLSQQELFFVFFF